MAGNPPAGPKHGPNTYKTATEAATLPEGDQAPSDSIYQSQPGIRESQSVDPRNGPAEVAQRTDVAPQAAKRGSFPGIRILNQQSYSSHTWEGGHG